jgi:hypothetical protein
VEPSGGGDFRRGGDESAASAHSLQLGGGGEGVWAAMGKRWPAGGGRRTCQVDPTCRRPRERGKAVEPTERLGRAACCGCGLKRKRVREIGGP